MLHADHAQERIQWIYWSLMVLLAASMVSKVGAQAVFFRDVAAQAGIDFTYSQGDRSSLLVEDMGPGAAFVDYDNDGDLDLYLVNSPGPLKAKVTVDSPTNMLYRNNGNGTFTNVTAQTGVGHQGFGIGCVFGDYDNDGDSDLYVTNYGPNALYRNNSDSTFTDVTAQAGVADNRQSSTSWSCGAAFGDYDHDGFLDLYVPNYVVYDLDSLEKMQKDSKRAGQAIPSALNPHVFEPQDNILYHNNGDGTFTDVTTQLGVSAEGGRSLQAIFTDFDLDNDLDLYVANDTSANFLYQNNGDGTFTDVSQPSWAADFRGSMGLATGDYDNDGDLDLFISHWIDEENALYNNLWKDEGMLIQPDRTDSDQQSDPVLIRLVDESYGAALAEESVKYIGWGTDLFDFDNDGDLDIFVANGSTFQELNRPQSLIAQQDQLFQNEGDRMFAEITESSGLTALPLRVGRGVAFGDYDNDGDVDLVVCNNDGRPFLLRNEIGNRNNWLQVKLVGTESNRDAIGAKVRLQSGAHGRTQLREINAGSSYLSFNSLTAEFGLGDDTNVNWVEVIWPGGRVSRHQNIPINQKVVITEGASSTESE